MNVAALPQVVERISTQRLLLRELRTTDFAPYAEQMADPQAREFTSGGIDRRSAWRFFSAMMGSWLINGAGWWGIELRETGEYVGVVGAFFRETAIDLGAAADLELGWNVRRAYWRRGFATEAAKAALAFGFARHPVKRAIAHIHPDNEASVGVSRALGMSYEGLVDFYGEKSSRYAIARDAR